MPFIISQVHPSDAESLVRECEFPAMQDNPLHLAMFPHSRPETWEDEIQWMASNLRHTLETQSSNFRKVCTKDGTPVGFIGWAIHDSRDVGNNGQRGRAEVIPDPETLDVKTWLEISRLLRAERYRVLDGRDNIWRLTIMAVNPAYQRRGVGSQLMQWACEEADRNRRDGFVLASPAAVRLYEKSGFEKVGEGRTMSGCFQSMFRKAQNEALVEVPHT